MKTLILMMSLLVLVSCGKGDDGGVVSPKYELEDFYRQWDFYKSYDGNKKFDSADFSNLNSVTFVNVERGGILANCVYQAENKNYKWFGTQFNMTWISGDPWICSQYTGIIHVNFYEQDGIEYMTLGGMELR